MRPLVALGVAAALALPAGAAAKGRAAGDFGHGAKQAQKGKPVKPDVKVKGPKKPKKAKTRALNVKGTVTAVGEGTVDVLVSGGNRRARELKGQTITVDVSAARIVVRDANGDGTRDLADVAVGDRVVVHARIAKGSSPDPAQPLAAKKVVDKGPKQVEPPEDDDSDDDGSGDDGSGEEAPPAL
jgi:hypothetical protein